MSYYYSSFDAIIENFYENRLSTLICNYYNKSITNAITGAFQEEFMPQEFGYYKWDIEGARKAKKWLMKRLNKESGKRAYEIKLL